MTENETIGRGTGQRGRTGVTFLVLESKGMSVSQSSTISPGSSPRLQNQSIRSMTTISVFAAIDLGKNSAHD